MDAYLFSWLRLSPVTCSMHKAGSTPSQGSGSVITHKIGQNVVVATTVLPQGHNLGEKKHRYSKPPVTWELRATACISGCNNLCKCTNVLRAHRTPLKLKQSEVAVKITRERERVCVRAVGIKEELLMREKQGTSLNILLTLKSFTVQGCESLTTVGQKVGKKKIKGFYSETVRCESHSALKISHLLSITACFNPRSLSEYSKWCSKPFHHCGFNHMLLFILDFLPPLVLALQINSIVKL